MPSKIVFYASEVSVICGLNPYRKAHDTFLEVWRRTKPSQIDEIENDIQIELNSREEKIEKLVNEIDVDGKISKLIKQASSAKTIQEVQQSVGSIESNIPTLPSDATIQEMVSKIDSLDIKADIMKLVESKMNRGFGTQQEAAAISKYEAHEQTNVGSRNDKFHKRVISDIDGCMIIVGGKVDGIKEDGTVIEVKNRMRRFFDPLPRYDIAQLQTYLFILDSPRGELVEQLKGNENNIKTTPIDRDMDMWNNIIKPKLIEFATALHRFINDSDLQQQFVIANETSRSQMFSDLLE
jgi:hypothetical protein